MTYDAVFLAPSCPGDLLLSRYAISLAAKTSSTCVVARPSLAPLLAELPVQVLPTLDHPSEVDALRSRLSADARAFDLEWTDDSAALARRLASCTVGVRFPDAAAGVYDIEVPWDSPGDDAHAAVRFTRYLDAHRGASAFDSAAWQASWFKRRHAVEPDLVALAPGCGAVGRAKRWPAESWIALAHRLRDAGRRLVWFIGPDERELATVLCFPGDRVQDGPWDAVVADHQRCATGVCNDTVHLHVRAHCGVHTAAIFRSSRPEHWGMYPRGVTCLQSASGEVPVDTILAAMEATT